MPSPTSPPEPELDRLLGAVTSLIDADRGPAAWLRERSTRVRTAVAAFAVLSGVGGAMALTSGWSWAGESASGMRPFTLLAYFGFLAANVRLALRPMQRLEAVAAERALGAAGVVLPFLAALVPLHDSHEVPGQPGYCLVLGVGLAAGLVTLFRALDRGTHSNRRMALLGVAAASMASNVALEFHCPITRPEHRLAFHASVGVVLAVVYAFVVVRGERRAFRRP